MRYLRKLNVLTTGIILPLLVVTIGIFASSAAAQSTMSSTEWESRRVSLDTRMTALNARVQSLLAQCSGSYPVEQLAALQAQCDQSGAALKAEMDSLLRERDTLIEQKKLIEAR